MLTPQEIVRRAERRFYDVLRDWLAGHNFSPLEFSAGVPSKDLTERRQQIEALRDKSRDVQGTGYTLEWDTLNSQTLGRQTLPNRIIIADLDDYLSLIRKRTVFDHFVTDANMIRQKFPLLESWIRARPQDVIEHHGKWHELLLVCDYFVRNPRPNVYLRELPIPVHTKLIERNSRILRDLLDMLLPPAMIDVEMTDFSLRFGLKTKPPLLRLRLLEQQLDWKYGLLLDDLSLPADQMAHLLAQHIRPKHVIIVENLINFLTLPKLPNTVGIWGAGFAVHLLRDISWLANCDVIYWGDLDAHGFEILSDLRGLFAHTTSLMMDQVTYDLHSEYAGSGATSSTRRFTHLTAEEAQLAQLMVEQNLRLEQEHIPQAYAVMQLKSALKPTL